MSKEKYIPVKRFLGNKLHSVGSPAWEDWNTGERVYYQNGLLHRPESEGPAFTHPDGSFAFYKNGLMHRESGPALRLSNGETYYVLYGKMLSIKSDQELFELIEKLKQDESNNGTD